MSWQIPIVDLEEVFSLNGNLKGFENAIKYSGGVYLVNHGVSESLIDHAFQVNRKFFELPKDKKLKFQKIGSGGLDLNFKTEYHGYTRPAEIQRGDEKSLTEFREAFDVCGTNRFFPMVEVPEFQLVMEGLENALIGLTGQVCQMLGTCLGLNEDYFQNICKNVSDPGVEGFTSLRNLYYPAIPAEAKVPKMTTRCGAHTDLGMFTLLLQDDIGGLKVQTPHGDWAAVKPIPGGILLLMGYLWEQITDFPALVHRVDFPEEIQLKKVARQSITYFVHPDADEIVEKMCEDGEKETFTVRDITMEKAEREGHRWRKLQADQ